MKRYLVIFYLVLQFSAGSQAQENESSGLEVSGYISAMPSVIVMHIPEWGTDRYTDSLKWQGMLHNRINIDWFPSPALTGSLQIRSQLMAGDYLEEAETDHYFFTDGYLLPLTFRTAFTNEFMLSVAIDRAWLQYTFKNFEIKAGRQRINWGQTFVWNPNDLFNAYNYFDFDYPERPGADAVRLQYYPGYSSSIDLAIKTDSSGYITGGGLYRFTRWNTEFQMLCGYFHKASEVKDASGQTLSRDDKDLVAGLGFSSGIKSVSLRGEMSYLHSLKEGADSTNQLMISLAMDHTLSNQLGIMAEVFYVNNLPGTAQSLDGLYRGNQSLKTLAFTKYNIFGQLSYPLSPILTLSAGGMYFFDEEMQGLFLGPSMELSLGDNLMMSVYYQFFSFEAEDPYSQEDRRIFIHYAFLRLKWNF